MKTRVQLINDAMEYLGGAFNCHKAKNCKGQEWIGDYIASHKHHARVAIAAARNLPAPSLP